VTGETGPGAGEPRMKIGYKLTAEAFGPQELIRQAVLAELGRFRLR
jgi:hypothetical protein